MPHEHARARIAIAAVAWPGYPLLQMPSSSEIPVGGVPIKKMVRWEDFRAAIEAVTETRPEERNSNAGRKAL